MHLHDSLIVIGSIQDYYQGFSCRRVYKILNCSLWDEKLLLLLGLELALVIFLIVANAVCSELFASLLTVFGVDIQRITVEVFDRNDIKGVTTFLNANHVSEFVAPSLQENEGIQIAGLIVKGYVLRVVGLW